MLIWDILFLLGSGDFKREIKMVSQNGLQNGLVSAYFPTYLRNLSEGLVGT